MASDRTRADRGKRDNGGAASFTFWTRWALSLAKADIWASVSCGGLWAGLALDCSLAVVQPKQRVADVGNGRRKATVVPHVPKTLEFGIRNAMMLQLNALKTGEQKSWIQ